MTIVAPEVLSDDPWFGPAPLSDANLLKKQQREVREQEELLVVSDSTPKSVESPTIHEQMFQLATSVATTLSLDPIPNLGGSEVWQSGSGLYN